MIQFWKITLDFSFVSDSWSCWVTVFMTLFIRVIRRSSETCCPHVQVRLCFIIAIKTKHEAQTCVNVQHTPRLWPRKKYKHNTFLFYPHFFFSWTKNYYFSDSEHKFVKICTVSSSNPTCAIIIFNQHIDAPHLSDCTKSVVLEVWEI